MPATLLGAFAVHYLIVWLLWISVRELRSSGGLLGEFDGVGLQTFADAEPVAEVEWRLIDRALPELAVLILICVLGLLLSATALEVAMIRGARLRHGFRGGHVLRSQLPEAVPPWRAGEGFEVVFTGRQRAIVDRLSRAGVVESRDLRLHVFADLDHGLAWCEERLIESTSGASAGAEVLVADLPGGTAPDTDSAATLLSCLELPTFDPGDMPHASG
jgi:hypothetical protein